MRIDDVDFDNISAHLEGISLSPGGLGPDEELSFDDNSHDDHDDFGEEPE